MNDASRPTAWDLAATRPAPAAGLEAQLRYALRCAILAPSSHNSQPWRFLFERDAVTLCADRLRALPVIDPFDRELIISCGAALFNLRVALAHLGLAYAIRLFPANAEPDVIAHVRVLPEGFRDTSIAPLFDAIAQRVTTRTAFAAGTLDAALVAQLVEAGETEGVQVSGIAAPAQRARIAELVAEADRQQFGDPRFRRELANWIHPRRSSDGMPAYAAGMPALLDFATPLLASALRTFDVGDGVAAAHQRLAQGSPLFVAIATGTDDRFAWLAAGQALERLLLVATRAGLSASYLNQPIEIDALRERLRALVGGATYPQLLLRVGRGSAAPHAPRRPLQEVVT
jgi:hypothetical protein